MERSLQILTISGNLPLSLDAAKAHLRVEHDDDDGVILSYLQSAIDMIERRTGRCYRPITGTLHLDCFPDGSDPLVVPRPPLRSVSAITYLSPADFSTVTLSSGLYEVIGSAVPGIIVPTLSNIWPVAAARRSSVLVSFAAGDVATCPPAVQDAIRLYLDHAYHEHDAVNSRRMQERIEALIGGFVLRDRDLVGIYT